MPNKNVLETAIRKLTEANHSLMKKMSETNDERKKEKYSKEITKNNAMILDYKFRLENEQN